MAASRRSPLMRDQWRAEDDYRDSTRRRERQTDNRRRISPAAPRHLRDTEGGLKIKGRAVADSTPASPSKEYKAIRREKLGRDIRRELSRSPPRRRSRDEQRSKRPREPSRERDSERRHHRHDSELTHKRRRTLSRSIEPQIADYREDRRRHRSPVCSGRIDKFRPRSKSRSRSRRRDRFVSPHRQPRGDYYSSSYPETSGTAGRFGDSYVPGSHHRPSPPAPRRSSPRRHSRSSDRHNKFRKGSPPPRKLASPDRFSRKDREPRGSLYRSSSRVKESSARHEERRRHRRELPPSSRPNSRGPARRYRSSQSPVEWEKRHASRTKMQQSPTRPIQSILDHGSRQSSQLQRIPSFDTSQGQSGNMHETFPMHGMKASDLQSTHRQARPPHLNTQHSYNTSPQWTPTSSHQGSPHSGSPFSHGRGGWHGQSQHYQGQPGSVVSRVVGNYVLTSSAVQRLIHHRIDREVILHSPVLNHNIIKMANKVHTVLRSKFRRAFNISLSVMGIPVIVVIIIVKRQIVGFRGQALRLQPTKGLLRLEVGAGISKTCNGLQAGATIAGVVEIVIKGRLCTMPRPLLFHTQSALLNRAMMIILSDLPKTCKSRIRQGMMQKWRLPYGKARTRPRKKAQNSALLSKPSLRPQVRQNNHLI